MKKITFRKSGSDINSNVFMEIEKLIGVVIPEAMKELFESANGGVPDECYFYASEDPEPLWIKLFLSFETPHIEGRNILDTYQYLHQKGFFQEPCIPFAIDHGGNFFVVNMSGGIDFIACDMSSREVSKSFEAFIDNLFDE